MTILTDEEINVLVKEAAQGSAIKRDGSTSQRIARAVEQAALEKLKQQGPVCYGVNKRDEGVWYIHQSKATCQGYAEHYGHSDAKGCDQRVVPLYAAPLPVDSLYKNLADEYGLSVFEDISTLKKQRDVLLAALEQIANESTRNLGSARIIARAAIARVKGGA